MLIYFLFVCSTWKHTKCAFLSRPNTLPTEMVLKHVLHKLLNPCFDLFVCLLLLFIFCTGAAWTHTNKHYHWFAFMPSTSITRTDWAKLRCALCAIKRVNENSAGTWQLEYLFHIRRKSSVPQYFFCGWGKRLNDCRFKDKPATNWIIKS